MRPTSLNSNFEATLAEIKITKLIFQHKKQMLAKTVTRLFLPHVLFAKLSSDATKNYKNVSLHQIQLT